jgi:hypothetical protein
VSDFFDLPAPPPEPPEIHRRPAWMGPPDNVVGVVMPLEHTLARTADVVLALRAATLYPTGIEFDVALLLREQMRDPLGFMPFHPRRRDGELGPDVLRLGVHLADGSKATNLELPFFDRDPDALPPGPVLMPHGGGGGDRRWSVSFWLWPLPPPGPFALVVEWPAREIGVTRTEVDVLPLLDAAARAEPLWPNGEAAGGGGFTFMQVVGKARRDPPPSD